MIHVKGYAAPVRDLAARSVQLRAPRSPGPHDVQIEILYCGVCHSDLHQARNDWGSSLYPMVPGHEIVGRVVAVGAQVDEAQGRRLRRRRLHGGFLPPLRTLRRGPGAVLRRGPDLDLQRARNAAPTQLTFGGYSEQIVVEERFVVKIPAHPRPQGASRRCCAPASPPIRRCGTGRSARARRSASSASAASATWASSSPRRSARTW